MKRFILWLLIVLMIASQGSALSQDLETGKGFVVSFMDWSPNGSKLAMTTNDGIRIYDQDFQLIQSFPFSDPNIIPYALWSPDGTRLTAGQMILDAATLKPLVITTSPANFTQWSPDGKFVVKMAVDYLGIELYDPQTGVLIKTLSTDGIQMSYSALLSPDGTQFLTRDHTNTIIIVDAVKGGVTARYEQGGSVSSMTWSPDNKRIAYAGIEEVPPGTPGSYPLDGYNTKYMLTFVGILDLSDGKTLRILNPLSGGLNGFSWSPDGTELMGVSVRGFTLTWSSLTGELIDSFLAPGQITAANYSPYGGRYTLSLNLVRGSLDAIQESFTPLSNFSQTFLDGMIQVTVPAPSRQKLETITQACGTQPGVQQSLSAEITQNDLQTFTQQVTALTDAQLPPGCKADLLAVAEALTAQGS